MSKSWADTIGPHEYEPDYDAYLADVASLEDAMANVATYDDWFPDLPGARPVDENWEATLRFCEKEWSAERGVMINRIQAVRRLRDGYADQARFADIDAAVHFREFVWRVDTALTA